MAVLSPLQHYLLRFEEFLTKFLNNALIHSHSTLLKESVRYSVLNAGKRLRPLLVYVTGKALGVPLEKLDASAAAIELIHCYSLIHDDLPAMDNDDLRRGKPSCHKAFNEATAVLAGDALQSLAFEVLSDPALNPLPSNTQIKMIHTLSLAAGCQGMVDGQALDMSATSQDSTINILKNIHAKKTGALITASVRLAGIAANVSPNTLERLTAFAKILGLAFQVQDDILDEEGNIHNLGKTPGKDRAQAKATFSTVLGLEAAKTYADALYHQALDTLNEILPCKGVGAELANLAKMMVYRAS